ncbi:MAG TPA: hypothetical protein DEB70_11025, partial [Planctomycetaceae bacterium]|nr:hypothetical protein [Planctomycetaceae bacterium]
MKRYAYISALLLLKLLAAGQTFLIADESVSAFVRPKDTPGLIIFSADFEETELGLYTKEQLNQDWHNPSWSDGIEEHRVWVVQPDPGTTSLTVKFPAHTFGSEKNGAVWRLKFDKPYSAVEVRYDVMFGRGFDFARGGKLPGLFGGKGNTGGDRPDGKDGFSARMMWRDNGRAVQYLYYPDQPDRYGH